MCRPGGETLPDRVATWLRAATLHDLVPPRRREALPAPTQTVEPVDGLSLGSGLALAIATFDAGVLCVPLAEEVAGPRRARPGDGAFAAMLRSMRSSTVDEAFRGVRFDRIPPAPDGEVAIDVDQSNESVVVGGVAVVKLFPITSPGPQPGLDLPVHLASVGFTSLPAPLGALRWTSPEGDEVVVATAASFLPGARDGWDWYLTRLLDRLDDELDEDAALEPASELGRICAHLHTALATPSATIPTPVGAADAVLADRWHHDALAVAGEALRLTGGDEGDRLAERAEAIRRELHGLGEAVGAITTRVHGDLHVGQMLEWDGGYAVTDFDGNPMAPPDARGALDTPVRDVAAFVRSLDHLGRIAASRRAGHDDVIESWIAASRSRFLDAYRGELRTLDAAALFDERLLRPLEVAQACHEYVYAARFLPRWRTIADRAMRTLLPAPDGRRPSPSA